MQRTRGLLALLVLAATGLGCGSAAPTGSPPTTACHAPAGGRCGGPAPITPWLDRSLTLAADGRTISGRFICGGRLAVDETATRVVLTLIAPAGGPGSMSCALVPLNVQLHTPLGRRGVFDGVTHQALMVVRA